MDPSPGVLLVPLGGLLLLIAVDDHKLRIEVGYGLEGALTDGESGDIIRNVIAPKFRANDYDGGISDGVDAIIAQLNGTAPAPSSTPSSQEGGSSWITNSIGFLVFAGIALLTHTLAFLGRSKRIAAGGIGGGVIGGLSGLAVGRGIIGLLVGAFGLGLFGLFLDWILSRTFNSSTHPARHSWITSRGGFYGGPSSGGGSDFGGFGGGSSGGGGASGSW